MKQLTLHQLWVTLFVVTLALTGIFAILLLLGHGSLPVVLGLLAVVCLALAYIFKRTTIVFWSLALIFTMVAFFTALHSI